MVEKEYKACKIILIKKLLYNRRYMIMNVPGILTRTNISLVLPLLNQQQDQECISDIEIGDFESVK